MTKTIICPTEIEDHSFYIEFWKTVLETPEPIYLIITGYGGLVFETMGIVSAIQLHGDVTGVLAGPFMSSYVTLAAACQKRVLFPAALMGVHPSFQEMHGLINSEKLRKFSENLEKLNNFQIDLLEKTTNQNREYWEKIFYVSSSILADHELSYEELLELEFGTPIDGTTISSIKASPVLQIHHSGSSGEDSGSEGEAESRLVHLVSQRTNTRSTSHRLAARTSRPR